VERFSGWFSVLQFGGRGRRDGLGLRNFYIFANLLSEEVVDLSMAGNGRRFTDRAVHIHRVTSAFTENLDTMLFQVTDQTTRFMK
jgi:hypothetical protein